jgi:hypothetical protein
MDENRTPATVPDAEAARRLRSKNIAVLAALVAFVALVYVVAMVRMSGG